MFDSKWKSIFRSNSYFTEATVPVTEEVVIESTGKESIEAISLNFFYDFCERCNITNCIRTENKSLNVIITFSSHVFLKTSPKFLKTKNYFNEIDIFEDTKMLRFPTFSEVSRSDVGFTDRDTDTT